MEDTKAKSFLTLRRLMLFVAFIIGLFVFISMFKATGNAYYDSAAQYINFSFPNVVTGSSDFLYTIGLNNSNVFTFATAVSESGVIPMRVDANVLLLIAYILVLLVTLGVNVVSFVLKDEKQVNIIRLSISGAMLVFAILFFLSPVLTKLNVADALSRAFGTEINRSHLNVTVYNSVKNGIWTIISGGLIAGSAFVKDCPVKEVKNYKWHVAMIKFFKKIGNWIKGLFSKENKKKEKKPIPEKKPAPKAEAEVVSSPRVDVSEEPKPISEPEVERVSPAPKKEEKPETPKSGGKQAGAKKPATGAKKSPAK